MHVTSVVNVYALLFLAAMEPFPVWDFCKSHSLGTTHTATLKLFVGVVAGTWLV